MRRTFSIFSGTIVGQAQQVECKVRATKVMLAGDPSVPAEFNDYRIMDSGATREARRDPFQILP